MLCFVKEVGLIQKAGLVPLVALTITLGGCTSPPLQITARHAPFFLEQPHSSQIVATASTADGLEHINIVVTAGEADICPSDANVPSPIPCRKNATTQGKTCFFQNAVTTGTCSITQSINPHTLVTYKVQAKSKKGTIRNLNPITYIPVENAWSASSVGSNGASFPLSSAPITRN